ncbi:hypothetical protein JN11_02199 [Mucilaginibacter frigoritolerans]|jgi:hypothetical protein|uniref:Uncharacterized protein n=1 Tax=Mucilaginibacter frigoritolerans TaxID=652788 RepID=A0A562U526_9SPHI|nr:hypothetical protein [Mucilaginibacter frigoritolerans]TWJ00936.1 hypothetical protein JN11_02199 [Mucilaginibacter frigoritolerans]
MKKDYKTEIERKGKSTKQGMVVLVIFIILFLIVMVRVALRSDLGDTLSNGMPSDNDAFTIAKDYIKTTSSSTDIRFTDDSFRGDHEADSVYVIKSTYESGPNTDKTNFSITLKYHGGNKLNNSSWSVISLIADN